MKHLRSLMLLFVALVISIGNQTLVFAQTDLEKAAVKEGKVVWYGGWPQVLHDKVAKAFKAHYPEIDVMIYRSGTEKVAAKFSAEKEAGAVLCDVFTVSDTAIYLNFKGKGFFEKFTPDEYYSFDERYRDRDGYWITPRIYTVGIWYNVEGLKKEGLEPPQSWRSLTEPKYKRKIVLGSPLYSSTSLTTIAYFVNKPGWGWDYWRKVVANEPLLISDTPDIARTVSTGEREIGPCIWAYVAMFPLHPKGTIKVVCPEEGVLVMQSSSALVKGRPHPHAGTLFQRFLMSKEVGDMIAGDMYYSGRPDVAPPAGMPSLSEVKTFEIDYMWLEEQTRDIQRKWITLTGEKKKE